MGGRELRSDSGGARRACGGVQSESSDGERAVGERADRGAIGEAVELSACSGLVDIKNRNETRGPSRALDETRDQREAPR